MNNTGITRCPQCEISFRVTGEQLGMADGAVRCGSCLTIFQAEGYMEDVPPYLEAEVQDEVLDAPIDNRDPADIDLEVPLAASAKVRSEVPLEAMEMADSILDEVIYLRSDKPHVVKVQCQDTSSVTAYWEAFELYAVFLRQPTAEHEQDWQPPPILVDPDFLVGEYESPASFSIGWTAIAITLMAIAVLQYLYFSVDSFATDIRYRQYMLDACQFLGCAVPEYRDAEYLATGDLAIRTHPEVGGALIIDAIVRNTGVFRQRFPDIILRFINPQGVFVATRTFSPGEYLAGEFRGLRYIPANTEVRFALDIEDPGEMAVGYDLSLIVR